MPIMIAMMMTVLPRHIMMMMWEVVVMIRQPTHHKEGTCWCHDHDLFIIMMMIGIDRWMITTTTSSMLIF